MPIETDLNQSPFWDDFDEDKNFHQILFRPGVAVQTRELNQLQTILQNQIERFGKNIYKDGTIIKGCSIIFDDTYFYAKVLDLQTDSQPVNASQYANTILINSSNVVAYVVNTADGLESQNPDLNTVFLKYIATGTDNERSFVADDTLNAYSSDYAVQQVQVSVAGTGYSNNDTIVFTSSSGTGATARIVTNTSGAIQDVIMLTKGQNYFLAPTVSIANSTGGTANGTGASLLANNLIGQLTVASNTFTNISNTEYDVTGTGYAVKVGDGIIFQKGYFIKVDSQTTVVSKYTNSPDGVVVGFETAEAIVNSNSDTSLYDNALGTTNENAPGAFRLKLTPTLTVKDTNDIANTEVFFTVVEFDTGKPVKLYQTTQFNVIGDEIAKRTSEESGDYIVKPINVTLDDISGNTSHIQARVGSGVAYVNGYRIEQLNPVSIPVRKGTDLKENTNVNISMSIGNYVFVNDYQGTLPFNTAVTVQLQDAINTGISTAAGNNIGTAQIRGLEYDSGTPGDPEAVYRLYIFNVKMNTGQSFSNVKSVFYNGSNKGTADLVLDSYGAAVIQDPSLKTLVFPTGSKAVKTLRDADGDNETSFIYSTVNQSLSFAANGILQKTLVGEVFPYSGTLSSVGERDFIFVSQTTVNAAANAAGTVFVTTANNGVFGTSTSFLSAYKPGDYISAGSDIRRIVTIQANYYMEVDSPFTTSVVTNHRRAYPAGQPIPFTNHTARTITVANNTMTASLGEAITGTMNVTGVYNVERDTVIQLTKNINKGLVVKIQPSANNLNGPWCLGIPDGHKITSVTRTSNSNYTTSATDITTHFTLDSGQLDTHYGLSYLTKKPTSSLTIANTDYILVTLDAFTYTTTGGGIGFFSVDSYPVDDATVSLPVDKIRTEEIPLFKSSQTSNVFDLRDSVDFRPVVSNTAVLTSTVGSATVNPSTTETFSATEKYFPAPDKIFETALQYYIGRYDKLTLNAQGALAINEGPITDKPYPPADINGAMTLATIVVPPYPTLSYKAAAASKRFDYAAGTTINTKKRFTMADINSLEKRVSQLEYYSALTLLEKQTRDLVVPSAIDPSFDSFKNGIFVDPLVDLSLTNSTDGEFTASIDVINNEITSRFNSNKFDLEYANSVNQLVNNNIATLNYTTTPWLVQPYASKSRTTSEDHWSFQGNIQLFPEYFNYYDVRFDPNTGWAGTGMISSFNDSVYVDLSGSGRVSTANNGYTNIYTDQSFINQVKQHIPAPTTSDTTTAFVPKTIAYNVIGDYLRLDIPGGQNYVYEHSILFRVTGLKPNTKYFARFDGVDVTYWTVGITKALYERNIANRYNFLGAGFGNPNHPVITSDSAGNLYGAFYMPRGYFFTGARKFEVLDSLTQPTSSATIFYRAYDYDPNAVSSVVSTVPVSTGNTTSTGTDLAQTPLPDSPFYITAAIDQGNANAAPTTLVTPTPLTQTFYVGTQDALGQDGIYVSKLDLYFASKDPTYGVSVELRTVESDTPTSTVVPQSFSYLPSANVNVSNTASVATTFNFDTPIFLKAGYSYGFSIKAVGNSPLYKVWIGQAGMTDVLQSNIKCRQDWGQGLLYTSTNDLTMQAVSDEDVKFTLHRTKFNTGAGTLTLTNRNEEFLSVSNVVSDFVHGEPVFTYSNTYILTGNVSVTNGSVVVSGTGTSFQTQLTPGAIIHIANTATPNLNSGYVSFVVNAITNSTSLSLVSAPNYSISNVKAYNAPTGIVSFYSETDQVLYLTSSTAANNTYKFSNTNQLVGTVTGATATIANVTNIDLSYIEPIIQKTTVSGASVTGTLKVANTSLSIQNEVAIKLNDTNFLSGAVVASRSNEITAASGKSFILTLSLATTDTNITPVVNILASSIVRYTNLINNDSTNENTSHGNAINKYVSKTITLADGQDAETLTVYLNGYKPTGTDIQVYGRFLNNADPDPLNTKSWTKLELVNADRYANPSNRNDYYEYQYTIPSIPTAITTLAGAVSTTANSTTVSGNATSFSSSLTTGSVVVINDTVNARYFVSKLTTNPANNTSLTVATAVPWTSNGLSISYFNDPTNAFLDSENDGVIKYYSNTSGFSMYKTFAIKIVLLSENTSISPRVKAPRALARTV